MFGAWQSTPLVVDGIMYVTQRPNDVLAVDAKTGRVFWQYRYTVSPDARVCCGSNNRGVAILGDTLFLATLDAHLVALDATNGRPLWNVAVGDPKLGYSMTMAPLVVKDKVLVGVGGGEYGIRGFIAAYDATTGKEAWRFHTIPGPGEPGHETWRGDAWKTGGGSIWLTPSYDPGAQPDLLGRRQSRSRLESGSAARRQPVHRLGRRARRRHRHAEVALPVHAERRLRLRLGADRRARRPQLARRRRPRRCSGPIATASSTCSIARPGASCRGTPFVKVNWASGLDEKGRPIPTPQPPGEPTWPGNQGGTNWYSPSFSPRTGLFYVSAWEGYASIFRKEQPEYVPGRNFGGGGAHAC